MEIQIKTDYLIHVPKFQATYLELPIYQETVPLFMHIIPDDETNMNNLFLTRDKLDLGVFWARESKYPSNRSNEGSQDGINQHIVIKPFGEQHFIGKYMHFGLYSQSGIFVRLGCSFKRDFYSRVKLGQKEKVK